MAVEHGEYEIALRLADERRGRGVLVYHAVYRYRLLADVAVQTDERVLVAGDRAVEADVLASALAKKLLPRDRPGVDMVAAKRSQPPIACVGGMKT